MPLDDRIGGEPQMDPYHQAVQALAAHVAAHAQAHAQSTSISPAQIADDPLRGYEHTVTPQPQKKAPSKKAAATSASAPAAAPTELQTIENLASPLATQLAFNQTIAPLLQAAGAEQSNIADQYGSILGGLSKDLPPEYRLMVQSQIPMEQANMRTLANEDTLATVTAPAIDQLMSQVQNATAAQNAMKAEAEKAIVYSQPLPGGSNPLAGLASSLGGVPINSISPPTNAQPGAATQSVLPPPGAGAAAPGTIAQLQALFPNLTPAQIQQLVNQAGG